MRRNAQQKHRRPPAEKSPAVFSWPTRHVLPSEETFARQQVRHRKIASNFVRFKPLNTVFSGFFINQFVWHSNCKAGLRAKCLGEQNAHVT